MQGIALSLVLKKRLKATRKCNMAFTFSYTGTYYDKEAKDNSEMQYGLYIFIHRDLPW